MPPEQVDVAIVGAGIVGLAHAYAAARKGLSVAVFERSPKAQGASVRNFGMIWPIGQPPGSMHQLALRSRQIWMELLERGQFPYQPTGSLHAMYRADEAEVAQEFAALAPAAGIACEWLNREQALNRSDALVSKDLLGALWSGTEMTVDPRAVLAWLPQYLAAAHQVRFHFATAINAIDGMCLHSGARTWEAQQIIVCGGDDFATLYPEIMAASGITRCKLQMLRTTPQPDRWPLGPSLAGGLTLQHYGAFKICSTLPALKQRIAEETPELNEWGIHILVSQTAAGEITLGDSHEYGLEVDIFDKLEIDCLILDHAERFLRLPDWSLAERWHGVYGKHPTDPYFTASPASQIRIVTGTGGAGMTLSFGLAEKMIDEIGI